MREVCAPGVRSRHPARWPIMIVLRKATVVCCHIADRRHQMGRISHYPECLPNPASTDSNTGNARPTTPDRIPQSHSHSNFFHPAA